MGECKKGPSTSFTRDQDGEEGSQQKGTTETFKVHACKIIMSLPRGMNGRYESLKDLYDGLSKQNVNYFISKCKLFLKTTNRLIQKEETKLNRKFFRGMFNEIGVLLTKAERKFKKKSRKSLKFVNCESALHDKISTGVIVNYEHKDLEVFLNDAREPALKFLEPKLRKSDLKVNFMLAAIFSIKEESQTMYLTTKTSEIFKSHSTLR